ncbi:MAG: carboxypeptidase-like regulatory domain-containing protein, partial [Planctomycetota bacterium]
MRAQPFLIVGLALLGAWIVQPDPPREVWGHEGEPALLPNPEDEPASSLISLTKQAELEERQVPPSPEETRRDVGAVELAKLGPLQISIRGQVFGVCIDANGAPCEGAWVHLECTPDPVLAARRSEAVTAFFDEQWTDANGRFFFEIPNEIAAGTLTVRLEKLGYSPVEWQVETARTHRINLQAVQLERPAFLHGSVVDSSGEPLARGWTVHARRLNVPEGMHRVAASHTARPGERMLRARRGHFELSSLAPGAYELITQFIDGVVQRGPEFDVIAGEERTVQITRQAPSLKTAVHCVLSSARPLPNDLAADDFVLTSSTGKVAPLKLQGRSLVAYGLEPDLYTLEVRDDRFAPSRLTGLRPGGLPRTWKLFGAESLQVDVRSALTGERIAGAWIQIAGQESSIHTLQAAHENAPASALHEGLALSRRRSTLLLAGAPGWVTEGPLELRPDSLQPQRTVELRLRPGTWIQGRFLVRGSTEPFPHDLEVYVHELSLDGEHWQSAPTVVIPSPGRGDGRFVLEALPHGKLLLEARSPHGGGAFHGST